MRAPRAAVMAVLSLAIAAACGGKGKIGGDDADGGGTGTGGPPDACVGLQCMQVNCNGMGIGTTRLSGTVYAPNGTLPLYNATVYVPNSDPGPVVEGVTCDRCNDTLAGNPVVTTTTDELGHFALDNVPVSPNLPVIIQMGKWRRQFTVATVSQCADNALPAATTSLPKNSQQGHIPKIAITTGGADALECLVRRLGIDDSEIGNAGGASRVELYAGNGGTNSFNAGFGGGTGAFTDATSMWGDLNALKKYDIVIFSCEGSQPSNTRAPATALKAVYDYANLGGRIFLSHWHNYWMEKSPAPWPSIATFDNNSNNISSTLGTVNQSIPRGKAMYTWLGGPEVKALDANGLLVIKNARNTCQSVTAAGDNFVYLDNATSPGLTGVQDLQFTTPNDKPDADRCGKVVFSDMHVASGSSSSTSKPYPTGCSTQPLTPQEKALAFIFFDISSCVGPIVN